MNDDMRPLFNLSKDDSSQRCDILLRIRKYAVDIVKEQIRDLYIYFPFERQPFGEIYIDEKHVVARINWEVPGRMLSFGAFSENDTKIIEGFDDALYTKNYSELKEILGPDWYGREIYTYMTDHVNGGTSSTRFSELLVAWLNDILTNISEENKTRILRAIPAQPQYDIEPLLKPLWVLESETDMSQGTGFAISGNRIVTCSHCVFDDTVFFKHDDPTTTYTAKNILRNAIIDIASVDIGIELRDFFNIGTPDEVKTMDHVLILGHPNYQIGDTVNIQPGLISGFSMSSGIRRMLTNAHIVAGCSGGPALDAHGKVFGVATTGAKNEADAHKTEDHGIVPINAIDLLE